jgi:phospholipid/cholesterol/gamma-HCH transport system ATP-binding protein
MQTKPILEFRSVTKFNDYSPEKVVLDNIDFQIYQSDITTIFGLKSGGESLILGLIAGLQSADKGEIVYNGIPISDMSPVEKDLYKSKISYVGQQNSLFDSMTVFENIAFPLITATKFSENVIKQKVIETAHELELTESLDLNPAQLSEARQKRVALARAIISEPEILIVDEPTAGQDFIQKNAILGMIARYKKKSGFTVILTSREIPDVLFISDRVLVLYGKRIVFQGTPEELKNFDHPFQDEITLSLENLAEELTGHYSRRHFMIRYQSELAKRSGDSFAVLVFSFDNMDAIGEAVSSDAAQQVLRSLGAYIRKQSLGVGGFSTRQSINEFAVLLPFSDLEEAQRILDDFAKGFREQGIAEVSSVFKRKVKKEACFDFSISAGMAQGNSQIELEAVIEFARLNKQPIAEFEITSFFKKTISGP